MASVEQRLQQIIDKDDIRELTAKYCFAVAENDTAAIVGLFTPDGVFKIRDKAVTGTEDLTEFYTGPPGAISPKPFIQNHVIEVDGDNATGRCGVEIRVVHKDQAYTAAGHYYDTYRRVDGRWLFAQRDFRTFHWVPLAKGWA